MKTGGEPTTRSVGGEDSITITPEMEEDYQRRLNDRFPEEVRKGCMLVPGETPDEYKERLHQLFPEDNQRAYVDALFTVAQMAVFGIYFIDCCKKRSEIPPVLVKMFPKEMNPKLYLLRQEGGEEWDYPVVPAKNFADDLFIDCNNASYWLERTGKELVADARERAVEYFADITTPFGGKISENTLREQIEKNLTPGTLGIYSGLAAQWFEEIRSQAHEPIDPFMLYAVYPGLVIAANDLNVYSPIIMEILDVHHNGFIESGGDLVDNN